MADEPKPENSTTSSDERAADPGESEDTSSSESLASEASSEPTAKDSETPPPVSADGDPDDEPLEGRNADAARTAPAPTFVDPAKSVGVRSNQNARWTLIFTSSIFLVTLFAWGGAKIKCNLHPPRYETFQIAPDNRLGATPKDGALEFHHRLNTLDFQGARTFATSEGTSLVAEAERSCDAACRKQKESRQEDALTRAVTLRREGRAAVVRAETHFQGAVDSTTYRVFWDNGLWKVGGRAE